MKKNYLFEIKKYIFLFLLFITQFSFSQQYPVRVIPNLFQPYSLRLGDYATSTDNKLQLIVLMTDLMEPQHQTGLKFSLEAGLNAVPLAQSNDFVEGMQPFLLFPGSNLTLTNIDVRALFELRNLNGINAVQYAQPLPDGMYRFCFQAYDYFTKRNLSDKSCVTAFLVQYDPPMLNLPQRGEKVIKRGEFQNLVFQWMPKQVAPNTRYIFTLKELWDLERDPVSGFLTSPPLWQEETYAPTLFYGLDKTQLIAGKRYAWQVQAKSGNPVFDANPTEDNGVYKNNGLSEIYYFDYVENCAVPTLLMAKNAGRGRVELSWSLAGQPSGLYSVQYRKRGSSAYWQTEKSYQPKYLITGLKDQTEYEYRIGSVCGNLQTFNNTNPITDGDSAGNAYAYSGIQYFTTDGKHQTNPNYQCGVMPEVDISNKKPLQSLLGANEVFMAGDFPVTVISAEGSNGIYSGTGYIVVPYLGDSKVKVSFNNIKLNTDKKLIEGAVETTYDPNESSIAYASSIVGETFGDQGVKEVTVDYNISDIKYTATPPPGKITIIGDARSGGKNDEGTGDKSQQDLAGGKDYQIKDKDDNIWSVDENGTVTQGGKVAEGGASTSTNTDGVTGSGNNATVNQYTAKGIKVVWEENANGQFAYDTAEKTKLPKDKYPTIKDADGNSVYVPYKATVNKQTELFNAKVSITDPALKDAKIEFKTLSIGKAIPAKELSKTDTERTYQLELSGAFDYAEEEVIAVLMPKEAKDKQQVISSFKLVHLSPKTVDVSLVPLDANSQSKLQAQGDKLNQIYKKIGINFNVKKEPVLDISRIVSGDTIGSEDADLMSTYSPQQQQINALYKGTDARYVLFVTDKKSSTGQKGYMRLNGQFGYVYNNAQDKTAAHELGHGVFKLEHPWKAYGTTQSATPLLMDYSTGEELSHLDWKQINDPAFKLYAFQSQSSGSYETDGHYSTVYLVSLMLGMNPTKAKELAIATEAPDTTIHNETKFELNDTWANRFHQLNTHSLTNGFHGADELITALLFLYTKEDNIKELGRLLHRYGDTYAHTEISNTPNWEQVSSIQIGEHVSPWINYINQIAKKDGLSFLSDLNKQKKYFKGLTFEQYLNEQYLNRNVHPGDGFKMYGDVNGLIGFVFGITTEHASIDEAKPDFIWIRPNWYKMYVENMAYLISYKFNLNLNNYLYNKEIFTKMLNFVSKNKCSMKGIIDYEIAKKLGKKEFYVPVFYSEPDRVLASGDAIFNTNYLQIAKEVVNNTKKYLIEQGIPESSINVEEINNWFNPKINKKGIFITEAFKITIK